MVLPLPFRSTPARSKFYFMNALFALGMVLGLMGLTVFLRWEYNLFGDPVGPLIFAVIFLFGDLLQQLLFRLADIKVIYSRKSVINADAYSVVDDERSSTGLKTVERSRAPTPQQLVWRSLFAA